MKGILSFLEKAGLVKTDAPAAQPVPPVDESTPDAGPEPQSPGPAPAPATPLAQGDGTPLRLDDIYASEGVAASAYPAERLLRLLDGLSAMDEATRQMAIRAMDAADESWTIDDPLADAAAKVKALAAHAGRLQANLAQLERETQAQLNAVNLRQEQAVGNIRKQITELEALASRELARAAQETATHEASLKAASEQTAQELGQVMQASQRLQSLALQFGTPANTSTGE
ncbi:MAG: hypothetical protein I8H71_06155 [Xanthomonadaceae bacterium]|nr:hypothetical protein [Xanthomonadaceae bacterium]